MGFTRIVLPAANLDAGADVLPGRDGEGRAELVGVRGVGEALDVLLG